jgi:ribonuclease P protein component
MINSRLTFKASQKIRKNAEYQTIFKNGKRLYGAFLRVHFVIEENQTPRIGVIISRKLKGSVIRNRYKRLIREFFRLHQLEFKKGLHWIVVVSKGFEPVNLATIEKELARLLNTAGLINKKISG